MLLSNLTREKSIAEDLVEASLAVPPGEICPSSRLLDLLTEVFVKAQGYNNKAEFHFLASVFANLTLLRKSLVCCNRLGLWRGSKRTRVFLANVCVGGYSYYQVDDLYGT